MKSKFNVAVWAGNSIGGTEKAAGLLAVELARRGHHPVYLSSPGPRDAALAQGNVPRITPPDNASALAEFLKAGQIDIIHQYVPGYPHASPIYEALRLLGGERPRLIETNIFGRLEDPQSEDWIDFRCFISCASAVQAFQRSRRSLNAGTLIKNTVLYFPTALLDDAARQRPQRDEIRRELGLQPHEILVLRFGRPGHKWNRDEVDVFQQARRRNPSLRILLMEPSEDIWREIEAGQWGDGIILRRALSDFDRLAAIYSAGDLMLHMSDWGESFGYTIAEAMQYGLPVITRSTPWCDNAQVELVEHGVTGYVCNSRAGAAEGILRLATDSSLRRELGAASAARIDSLSNISREADLLEEILAHAVSGQPLREVIRRNQELLRFQATFAAREKRILELDLPGLATARWEGAGYGVYRILRARLGQIKSLFKHRT
ncbi:MAG TPA: glycosyltransferase family 4 protein [Candidatus Methylacidiphilales bacterium]|nr:glycosyltransferase family 4 protein [Candidatus Methylacidiphilales bacterium]